MRKFYNFLIVTLLSMVAMWAHADTKVTVNVDDVDRVQVENGYGNVVADLQNGDNTIEVPQYGTLYFKAKTGALLQKITKNGSEQYMSSLTNASLYISESDEGAVIAVTSANEADVRTGKMTVTIDDPAKARVSLSGTYTEVQLQTGENEVKFIPGVETQLLVSAIYPNTLYKVLVNNVAVTASHGSYYIDTAEGTKVEIQANFPDVKYPVTFSYLDEASKGFISKVTVDNTEVTNYNDADFKVQAGSKLDILLNTTDYKLDEYKLNGTTQYNYSNSINLTITDETTLYFAAHKYASVTANLDVDNYDNIIIYKGYDQSNLVEVKDNKITVLENDNVVRFAPKSGCKITSLTVNGQEQYADYSGVYAVSVTADANIVVKTYAIVRDKTATVIVKDLSAANYGFSFLRSDRTTVELTEGENTITFSEEADSPFMLSAYGSDLSNMVVYLDGMEVSPYYEGGTSYNDINLKNGSVLEIYLKGGNTTVRKPIIRFHTTLYDDKGDENAFSISLGAVEPGVEVEIDCGNGPQKMAVSVAAYNQETGELGGSFFSGSVGKDGIVSIYGDPEKIDYLNAGGCYITDISFDKDLNLDILNLEYNTIKSLDLDKMTKLKVLYLCDNPFSSETPLMLGRHENLLVLDIAQVGNVSPRFDLKNFPSLMTFNAFYATTLKTADSSECPYLVSLSLDMTSVETVDVSKNPNLEVLNVSDSRVKSFDVSKNAKLTQLYFDHTSGSFNTDIKVDKVDVTNNPLLYILYGGGNNLKTLDVTKNPKLFDLSVPYNYLTEIDLSTNKNLYNLNLGYNRFGYSTLPAPGQYNDYYYPQRDFELDDYIKVGTAIDFSSLVVRKGLPLNNTTTKVYYIEKDDPTNPVELDNSYYTIKNCVVTFSKPYDKPVYVEYSNTLLNQYNLRTETFTVLSAADYGKDTKQLSFASDASTGATIELALGVKGASKENPVTAKVDFGDGTLKSFTIDTDLPTSANISGTREGYQNIDVYLPMAEYVTAFGIRDINITNINFSELTELKSLEMVNTGLYSIDLSYNANLNKLDLSGNNLKTLSLKGPNNYYYKATLHDVNLSNNALESLEIDDFYALHNFNISGNKFTEMDLSDADNIETLNISGNLFESMMLTNSLKLVSCDLSNNNISQIYIPEEAPVEYLNISGNKFTLANMPDSRGLDSEHFVYAPQQTVKVAASSPGIDLSEQYVDVNGQTTSFVWKRTDGGSYVEGTDYTISKGSAKFLTTDVGSLYCEMTHPAYPAFAGDNVLKTTLVTPIEMPEVELASFVTANDGDEVTLSLAAASDGTSVYFDWNGDGNVTQYTLGTAYTRFYATTKANTKVRVLVAEEADKFSVFSISGAKMSEADFSKLNDVPAITIAEAGLSEVNIPAPNKLNELNLSGNKLTSFDITKYPNLVYLSLNSNELESIDISSESLQLAYLGNNSLTEVKMNNNNLWNLDLTNNKLENLDLSGCPSLQQLFVMSNELSELDITPVKNVLQVLNVVDNKLAFSTLPRPTSRLASYSYGNQAPLITNAVNGKVDLSAEADVEGTKTEYRWFVGEVYVNEEGEFEGEELTKLVDYTIANGVTTFKMKQAYDNLVCIMTNEVYPNLIQYTDYVDYNPTATNIESVGINAAELDGKAFTINGMKAANSTRGIVIKNGKKMVVK